MRRPERLQESFPVLKLKSSPASEEPPTNQGIPISVELSCQQALADLEALSGPWQDAWETSDLDLAALLLRLFGTHLQAHSDRIMKAMIFERLDAVELAP